MKTKIYESELRQHIINGITTEELNSKYDYSHITDMSHLFDRCSYIKTIPILDTSNACRMFRMFYKCINLKDVDPYNFKLYDWPKLENDYLKEKYPELYI